MARCIAIDGPAAAGKGTIARALARELGFHYLDTGLLYRAIGSAALKGLDPIEVSKGLTPEALIGGNLRTQEVAKAASKVAEIQDIRSNLIEFQRKFSCQEPGSILDGRDIGTVICPKAAVKIFVTASDSVRAQRRLSELQKAGGEQELSFEGVLEDIRARDARDNARSVAPLRMAEDAHIIDTSDLSIPEAIARALKIISSSLAI